MSTVPSASEAAAVRPAAGARDAVGAPGGGAGRPGITRQVVSGLVLRISRYPLQVLFVLAVPPLLGPDAYGAYATCAALFALVTEATDLGTVPVFGRLLPGLAPGAASALVRQVLWSRLVLALGPGSLLLAVLWTPRPEDPLLFALVVGAVAVVPVQQVLFARLYARGEIARFMARDPLRSALSLALVVPGYLLFGLPGAVGALVLAQATLVGIGTAWARPAPVDLSPPASLAGLPGTLRFGLAAALPTALTVAALKLGTPLLSRAGRPAAEVAAFDLATQGLVLVTALAAYPFSALLPTLGREMDGGRGEEARRWIRAVVGRSAAAAAIAAVALVAVGERFVRLALGPDFAAVYPNLLVLVGGGIFPALVAQAGLCLAVLDRRPIRAAWPAAALVLATGAGTLALAGSEGAFAAAASLAVGLVVQALALAAVTPGLTALVSRPIGTGLAAALPALTLGGLEAAGEGGVAPAARVAILAAAAVTAAWPLAARRWRRPCM